MNGLVVVVDDVARASLAATGTTVEHLIEHHHAHLSRPCDCFFGKDGQTAMQAPDGTVLVIGELQSGVVFISGHRRAEER